MPISPTLLSKIAFFIIFLTTNFRFRQNKKNQLSKRRKAVIFTLAYFLIHLILKVPYVVKQKLEILTFGKNLLLRNPEIRQNLKILCSIIAKF